MPIDITLVAKQMPPPPGDPMKITMPCGGEVVASLPALPVPSGKALAQALIDKANAAMTPLAPIFKMLDAFLALVEAVKAVPGMITDPTKLFAALEKLAGLATMLTKLIPQLSIPLLAIEFLDALIAYLEGLIAELEQLIVMVDRIDEMREASERYPALNFVVQVSEYNVDVLRSSMDGNAKGVETITRFVNVLLQLAGLEGIPSFADLPDDMNDAVYQLRETLTQLRRIRSLIPVP